MTEVSERYGARRRSVRVSPAGLDGIFAAPSGAAGLVIFAHGSGSSRLSPRNTYVADALGGAGFATLLFDLLTEAEARDRANVFDIPLLAERLLMAVRWARAAAELRDFPIGLFGASTGGAAAIVAAADAPAEIAAVVSRGGRPDLAGDALDRLLAPTLLIVGGDDVEVLALNRAAFARMGGEKALRIVPHATHLFEEPGTLDRVIDHAASWFATYLAGRSERGA